MRSAAARNLSRRRPASLEATVHCEPDILVPLYYALQVVGPGAARRRLWRLRKVHRHIDAELYEDETSHEAEVRIVYDDLVIYTRRWSTRQEAAADAHARLADLERAGWTSHW